MGTQIHEIDPINKGEVVWYVNPQDVLVLGRYSLTGVYDASKTISLCGEGSSVKKYFNTISGSNINAILNTSSIDENSRILSGNPLTGDKVVEMALALPSSNYCFTRRK